MKKFIASNFHHILANMQRACVTWAARKKQPTSGSRLVSRRAGGGIFLFIWPSKQTFCKTTLANIFQIWPTASAPLMVALVFIWSAPRCVAPRRLPPPPFRVVPRSSPQVHATWGLAQTLSYRRQTQSRARTAHKVRGSTLARDDSCSRMLQLTKENVCVPPSGGKGICTVFLRKGLHMV